MKQSNRAVPACATQLRHKRARWALEPTVAARSMFRPRHETTVLAVSKSSISLNTTLPDHQNDETPVGSAFRGL